MPCASGWRRLRLWTGLVLGLVIVIGLLQGCTSMAPVAPQDVRGEAGQPVALRVCIYKDHNVSMGRVHKIAAALRKEFAPYGLDIQVSEVVEWERASFRHNGILKDIAQRPMPQSADRILALVGRDARDFLWGILLPEVLGAVETRTYTRGFVVAQLGSLNQLLAFQSPSAAAVHEFYHLLGCTHADDSRTIVAKIERLKGLALQNRRSGRDFFPAVSSKGHIYFTRSDVDAQFPSAQTVTAGLTAHVPGLTGE